MEKDICKAPLCDRERKNKNHCQYHMNKLIPIYQRYKRLSNELPNISNTDNVKELVNLYNLYYRIYDLRKYYQKKGFKDEYQDFGHTKIIDNIWMNMCLIASKLENIVKINKEEINKEEINKEEYKEEYKEPKIYKRPKQILKAQKKISDESTLKILPCLRKEIEKENKVKDILLNKLFNFIEKPIREHLNSREDFKNGFKELSDKVMVNIIDCVLVYLIRYWFLVNKIIKKRKTKAIEIKYDYFLKDIVFKTIKEKYSLCCIKSFYEFIIRTEQLNYFVILLARFILIDPPYCCLYVEWRDDKVNIALIHIETNFVARYYVNPKEIIHEHKHPKECDYCIEELKQNLEHGKLHK